MKPEARKIAFFAFCCTQLGVLHGVGYGVVTILPGLDAADTRLVLLWALGVLAASYTVILPISRRRSRPIGEVIAELDAGRTPTPALLATGRRNALNLPWQFSIMSLIAWVAAALTFPPVFYLARGTVRWGLVAHIMAITILIGSVSASFMFYVIEWRTRVHSLPRMGGAGRMSELMGVRRVQIRRRILFLVIVTCGVPVDALTLAAFAGTLQTGALIYISLSSFVFGALLADLISHSIDRPVVRLTEALARVKRGDLAGDVSVVSADKLGELAEGFNDMVAGLRRAEYVKDTFGRYVSSHLVAEIERGTVAMGGETRTATVLFSDIRGFTAMSEPLPPAEVVRLLNRYLDIMCDVIVEHGGLIDKFIGDAIMAVFGVPLGTDDHARHAVECAMHMIERLADWNAERAAAGEPVLSIGIGLHSGPLVAGNIGSTKKLQYTVIGDTVNTAARIEQLNKQLGTTLLVSAETRGLCGSGFVSRPLDPIEVKGKKLPLQVYEVTARAAS